MGLHHVTGVLLEEKQSKICDCNAARHIKHLWCYNNSAAAAACLMELI